MVPKHYNDCVLLAYNSNHNQNCSWKPFLKLECTPHKLSNISVSRDGCIHMHAVWHKFISVIQIHLLSLSILAYNLFCILAFLRLLVSHRQRIERTSILAVWCNYSVSWLVTSPGRLSKPLNARGGGELCVCSCGCVWWFLQYQVVTKKGQIRRKHSCWSQPKVTRAASEIYSLYGIVLLGGYMNPGSSPSGTLFFSGTGLWWCLSKDLSKDQ